MKRDFECTTEMMRTRTQAGLCVSLGSGGARSPSRGFNLFPQQALLELAFAVDQGLLHVGDERTSAQAQITHKKSERETYSIARFGIVQSPTGSVVVVVVVAIPARPRPLRRRRTCLCRTVGRRAAPVTHFRRARPRRRPALPGTRGRRRRRGRVTPAPRGRRRP